MEERLDDVGEQKTTPASSRFLSTPDPDASVTHPSGGKSKLRYKTHRGVDPDHEVINATLITRGSIDEGAVLKEVIEAHEQTRIRGWRLW